MDYSNKIARYEEIERRGLLDRLPPEKQEAWAEYKRRQQPKLNLSDEQKAQIEANNKAYEEKYAEPFIESDIVRKPAALVQGISNASLNPFGYLARSAGIDTKPLEAKDAVERALEKGGEYGYDAAALATVGNLAKGAGYLGKGNTVASKVAQEVLAPEVLMATGAGVGGGLVEGVTNPSTAFGSAVANVIGASVPASVGGALEKQIYNVKGGLENILSNNKGVQAVSRGIATDEAIANRVKEEAPVAMNNLNERMREALNRLTGRKLDIDRANISQKERYDNFISRNANKELYSPKTAKQQAEENFNKWFEGSKIVDENGQPLKLYHGTSSKFDKFKKGNIFFVNDKGIAEQYGSEDAVEAYLNMKNPYVIDAYGQSFDEIYNAAGRKKAYKDLTETDYKKLADTFFDGDIKEAKEWYPQNEQGEVNLARAYGDKARSTNEWADWAKKQGYDGVIIKDVNDTPDISNTRATDYIVFEPNQIKSVNNSGAWSNSASLSDVGWKPKTSLDFYTQGLNAFQKDALNQALSKGAYMSTNAKGTLGATHRGQEVLNDMIEASYDTSIIGQKKPTTETRQLMQVKERLNQILEPSGIKPYDAGLSKAKALEDAYEKGYKFKPSETKFDALGLEKARDKRAFLQGRIASILDNVKDDKNIAKAIQADENTLRKLMPEGKYKQLLKDANNISTEYERVRGLANQAESKLVKKTPLGRPMSEKAETRGAIIGSILDRALSVINRRGDIRKANQYLNPETTQIVTREGLKGAAKKGSAAIARQILIDRLNEE